MTKLNESALDDSSPKLREIEFRDSPQGPVAYVTGTRTAVWLIVGLVQQQKGKIAKVARIHDWPQNKVQAAMDYAKAFPMEIEPLIEKSHKTTIRDLQP